MKTKTKWMSVAAALFGVAVVIGSLGATRREHSNANDRVERGKYLVSIVGCTDCHKPGLFTSLKQHDVGTHGDSDNGSEKFDTPTLIEAWRSAPYLHDGSAATVRDVITTCNPNDRHGTTSHLTPEQLNELAAYVLSL